MSTKVMHPEMYLKKKYLEIFYIQSLFKHHGKQNEIQAR